MRAFAGKILVLGFLIETALVIPAEGRDRRPKLLPNALVIQNQLGAECLMCHTIPEPEEENSPLNAFGMQVEDYLINVIGSTSSSRPFWGPDLAGMDADGDGHTNGEELNDPTGTALQERFGLPLDQNFPFNSTLDIADLVVEPTALVSYPFDAASTPPSPPGDSPTPTVTNTSPVDSPTRTFTKTQTPIPSPTNTASPPPTGTKTQTPIPSPTNTLIPSPTASPTSSVSAQDTPTSSHTPTNSVTSTPAPPDPSSTPTPSEGTISSPNPTGTECQSTNFNRDAIPRIDARDLTVLLGEGLIPGELFRVSFTWHETEFCQKTGDFREDLETFLGLSGTESEGW